MAKDTLKFALFGNTYQTKKSAAIRQVVNSMQQTGAGLLIDREYYQFLSERQLADLPYADVFSGDDFEADVAISMGGDGTFLKTAGRVMHKHIPILGINMGRLGFLADIAPDEIQETLQAVVRGEYCTQHRSVIEVELLGGRALAADSTPPGSNEPQRLFALNDVAILKRDTASMITIRASIDGEYLTTYQADGLIVSTPTGSTAYSLSNGGPIIAPGTGVMLITAVAPHSLNVRPIVIPDTSEVTLYVESRSHSFLVAADGQSARCSEGTTVTLRRSPADVLVVKRTEGHYFATLREKMMWGADVRE